MELEDKFKDLQLQIGKMQQHILNQDKLFRICNAEISSMHRQILNQDGVINALEDKTRALEERISLLLRIIDIHEVRIAVGRSQRSHADDSAGDVLQ